MKKEQITNVKQIEKGIILEYLITKCIECPFHWYIPVDESSGNGGGYSICNLNNKKIPDKKEKFPQWCPLLEKTKTTKTEDKIYQEVNNLIKSLYNSDGTVNIKKLKELQLYGSPVNWGDLSCCYVERAYVVYISEAAPDAYTLQRYIEKEMRKKGYKVKVITEW